MEKKLPVWGLEGSEGQGQIAALPAGTSHAHRPCEGALGTLAVLCGMSHLGGTRSALHALACISLPVFRVPDFKQKMHRVTAVICLAGA